MATRRYDPFAELNALMNSTLRQSSPAMPMDLYRTGDEYHIVIDMPGVDPSSIDIDVEDRTLTVRAERKSVEGEDVEWISHERGTGTYARQLTLGYGLDLTKIDATYTDGVLALSIPVAEEAKPRKIQVNTNPSSTQIDS
ncbi:MAG TPA: Hsp20/alpha crystallin family protein [Actinomycetaceae bacterium]|nr:Hsp20/alpha crystallin family protein [Actinomycetaceae bacterium]